MNWDLSIVVYEVSLHWVVSYIAKSILYDKLEISFVLSCRFVLKLNDHVSIVTSTLKPVSKDASKHSSLWPASFLQSFFCVESWYPSKPSVEKKFASGN